MIAKFRRKIEIFVQFHINQAWDDILQCAYNTTKFPRPSIFSPTYTNNYGNDYDYNSSASTPCFDLHATNEVKESLASIGDYHIFLIDRAFAKQSDKVMLI